MRFKPYNVLLCVIIAILFIWQFLFTGTDLTGEDLMEKRLAELRDRVHHAESLSQERENDILTLRRQINLLLKQVQGNSPNHTVIQRSEDGKVIISDEVKQLLTNFTLGSSDISPPNMFHYLPHLIGKPEGLTPAYKLSQGRSGVSIFIAVPHIKREQESYLERTLQSLIDSMDEEEKQDCVISVFVAEPHDMEYVKSVGTKVENQFKEAVASGLLEVVSPPAAYYPNLDNLKETFGDPKERVKWRTKQNLDFCFLMMYGKSKATYYVQLEDDIVSKSGYISTMKNFALNQNTEWILLEFSHLGFIGKLFKSSDLPMVVEFFLMFHKDKPIDWLLDHLLFVKVCNPEKDNKHCQRSIAQYRIRFKPSLFQHIGTHSSLKGKVQKLKDKDFGRQQHHKGHINPNAEISSTFKIYQHYSLDRAWRGETFFWGTLPKAGDLMSFKFMPPIVIEKYLFKSGTPEHPGDKFYNTTVEVLPVDHLKKQEGILDNKLHVHKYPSTADGFLIVGNFSHSTGTAEGSLEALGAIHSLRLKVQTDSTSWVILNEIHIKSKKTAR